ncbi:hypothetical protein Hanom_Chr17g01582771 [Helianthus anomalus]
MEKMYRLIRELCAKAEVQPMFSATDIFDYKKFNVEEDNRKSEEAERKKRRLESAVNVNEDDERDEEEVDRDEMLTRFVEWGLEEEVLYETEEGDEVVNVEKTEVTDKIISWKYFNLKGMFIMERRGGVIQYFKTGYNMTSLPRWDIRELRRLELINPTNSSIGADFERLILRECNRGFTIFKPQGPGRRVSKTMKDLITGKGKVTLVINLAKVVRRVKIPPEIPVTLTDFKKWFYDGKNW